MVANDPYELRIVVPGTEKSWRATGIKVAAADAAAGVKAEIKQDGPRLRATIKSLVSRDVKWTVAFERGSAVDVVPPPVANLKAKVEYSLIALTWADSGAASYRITRSDGEVSTELGAMFTDTQFPREKPLTYRVEALGSNGKAAAPVSIGVTPLTVVTAPPTPPLPAVYLDPANTVVKNNGWGQAQFGKNISGNALSLDGKKYEQGMGLHAAALALCTIPKNASRFVAVVGVDDSQRKGERASVMFEVYGDVKEMGEKPVLLAQSPVLSATSLFTWNFNVELNARFKELRLVVTDAGDGVSCDHANWVNAGFVVPKD